MARLGSVKVSWTSLEPSGLRPTIGDGTRLIQTTRLCPSVTKSLSGKGCYDYDQCRVYLIGCLLKGVTMFCKHMREKMLGFQIEPPKKRLLTVVS
jgi:hypothetical protein